MVILILFCLIGAFRNDSAKRDFVTYGAAAGNFTYNDMF